MEGGKAMGMLYVSGESDVANGSSRTFEERKLELESIDAADAMRRKYGGNNKFKRYSQKNLDRTKELVWLALNHPVARAIFDVFEDKMDRRNAVVCSNKALSEILGVSESTVKRATKVLRDKGFVNVLKTGKENIYALNDTVSWKNSGNKAWMSAFPATVILCLSEQEQGVQDAVIIESWNESEAT